MATHKLAILVSAIGAAKAAKDLKGVDAAVGSIGSKAGQGLRTAGRNIAGIGVIAAAGISVAVKSGLQDLATLESAVTSVDGAIKQMGLTGKVTGGQVAGWANEIEAAVGAAFDDKDITAATENLIRYGKVTDKNLRPAMEVMTDLAAKTGSVESASELLGKALADPIKATGKLSRYGILLTKQEQKQIKAMVEAGDAAGAQAKLLDILSVSTKGAAAASQGPYARSLAVLTDVSEDARKALAEGFLPVITKVADLLSSELAKPETLNNIRDFGNGLAAGLDDVIDIAKNLPWQTIGDSMKIAGAGGKALLGAFTSMPAWVQTAVLTGWGLNKLTGGALSGIVGELGKGLIKGVLGMTAGVVNLKAGVVNGAGGASGGVAGAGGKGGVGKLAEGAGKLLLVGFVAEMASQLSPVITGFGQQIHRELQLPDFKLPIPDTWPWGPKNTPRILPEVFGGNGLLGGSAAHSNSGAGTDFAGGRGGPGGGRTVEAVAKGTKPTKDAVVEAQGKLDSSIQRAREAARQAGTTTAGATRSAGTIIAGNATGNATRIINGFAANRPIVSNSVRVYVTGNSVTRTTTTQTRYGSGTGSAGTQDRIGGK